MRRSDFADIVEMTDREFEKHLTEISSELAEIEESIEEMEERLWSPHDADS